MDHFISLHEASRMASLDVDALAELEAAGEFPPRVTTPDGPVYSYAEVREFAGPSRAGH